MKRLLLLCLFPCWFLSARAGFVLKDGAKTVKIPIDVQNNIILVPLSINGSFQMNFILDTGVRTTILTESILTPFLGLDSLRTIRVRGLGEGESIKAGLASNVYMDLPGVTGRGLRLIVLPQGIISYSGMFGKPVHGIIGHAIFSQFVVEIDYKQKFIRLHDPFEFKYKKRLGVSVPITLKKGKPYVQASLVDQYGMEFNSEWLFDTGASQAISLFDESLKVPSPNLQTFLGKGLSGNVFGKLGRVKRFQIGYYDFEDVIAGYPQPSSLGMIDEKTWYGNIGAEIISRFRVYVDYLHGRIILKKNSSFKDPFTYNISGLEVETKGKTYDSFYISYVRPGSPAYQAGVKSGDEIVSMNGSPLISMDLDELYLALNRRPGKRISLKLRRGGDRIKKKFVLESEI